MGSRSPSRSAPYLLEGVGVSACSVVVIVNSSSDYSTLHKYFLFINISLFGLVSVWMSSSSSSSSSSSGSL